MRAPRWIRAGLAALVLLQVPGPSSARAEIDDLTLFQRCGRSPWIVIGEVTDGDDRLAEVRIIEVLKGEYSGGSARIVYRLENWLREGWEGKIAFRKGDTVVLFLKRYDPEDTDGARVPEKLQAEDVFASSFGARGVFPLPAEGQEAYVEAVRIFSRVSAMMDPVEREEAILEMLGSPNPHVLQAGLEQVLARRLASAEHVSMLLHIADGQREPDRLGALRILSQVAEDMRLSGETLPDQVDVVSRLKGKVLGSEPDDLRAEALKAIALMGGKAEKAFLRRISREDPSQRVRYEASRSLLDLEN